MLQITLILRDMATFKMEKKNFAVSIGDTKSFIKKLS